MTSGHGPGSAGRSCPTTSPARTSLCRRSSTTRPDTITGNQRQADLGSPEGLQAWRDMVIAQVKRSERKGRLPAGVARRAARRDRRPGPRPDRGRIRAVVSRDQRRATPSSRHRASPGTAPPQTTSPSPSSPRSKAVSSSPRSSATPVPSKPPSTPSSNSPASASRTRQQTASSLGPRSHGEPEPQCEPTRRHGQRDGKEPDRNPYFVRTSKPKTRRSRFVQDGRRATGIRGRYP